MTSDGEALFRAICEEPWEDTPRLVYADWLDENGDPARAEFIRVQIELARVPEGQSRPPELVAREAELLKKSRGRWLRGMPHGLGVAMPLDFRRGFQSGAWIKYAKVFRDRADDVFGWAPIETLGISKLTVRTMPPVLESRYLARLTTLSLSGSFGDAGCEAVADCPWLLHLRTLHLYGSTMTDAGLLAMARSRHLGELRGLAVIAHHTDRGALALADAPGLAQVRSLHLLGTGTLTPAAQARLRERFAVTFWH
jgi:uncharacterized protein (TIGR02996 family)